jgi:hypothetical protein
VAEIVEVQARLADLRYGVRPPGQLVEVAAPDRAAGGTGEPSAALRAAAR